MIEHGFFTREAGSYQERIHHIQLAYASYAALLAALGMASLLGEKDNLPGAGRRNIQSDTVASNHKKTVRDAPRFLHHFYFLRSSMNSDKDIWTRFPLLLIERYAPWISSIWLS